MTMSPTVPGLFTLVLHSHLPWFAHHGAWPVGEELLYQAWGNAYIPVVEELYRLAEEGYRDVLSLGITPIVAAQLDDPYCLRGMHEWLANWQMRAAEAASFTAAATVDSVSAHGTDAVRAMGGREEAAARWATERFLARWTSGGSPVFRPLQDDGVVEMLGGPLAHPFQPLLPKTLRRFFLESGLSDSELRRGTRPAGLWAPECAFTPGMEVDYQRAGVTHFMVDGPSLHGDTACGRPVGASDVVAFGRDLTVSYRVWSPKAGYPGHADYRDFHTYHHETGFKPARVTGRSVSPEHKAPYNPERAAARVDHDVADFVETVVGRLQSETERCGRPAHVIAAFDTELFGHWWHEGPEWLGKVIRALHAAGVRVGSLATARAAGYVGTPVELGDCSWGSGKDWRVWEGPQVADIVELNQQISAELATALWEFVPSDATPVRPRDRYCDQIVREATLALQSDWAFLISKDTAADYARNRAYLHAHAMRELITARRHHWREQESQLLGAWQAADGPFSQLDARLLRNAYDEED